jgi:ribosome-binding factor A
MPRPAPASPTLSQRQLRVGEALRHALAEALERGEVMNPLLQSTPVTISEVRASPDLKQADVYFMPLGGERRQELLKAMAGESPLLRRAIARRVELRSVPKLRFRLDTSFDTASEIDALLKRPEIARDLGWQPEGDASDAV